MRVFFEFLAKTSIFSFFFWGGYFLFGFQNTYQTPSLLVSWGIVVSNSLIGFALFQFGYSLPTKSFFTIVLGGLAVRMFATLAIAAFLILGKKIAETEFIFGLIFFYIIFFTIEIFSYLKKIQLHSKEELK
ncbi:MAG: hypothetical protein SFU91_10810 [Chloroherpetonaceae bacterium]|nr:hypothetical protein [Chloroherpetonaceae bacterium]